ncbi:MAG: glucosyl-3-phosphoglycerate synthase [Oceanococcaceae bacterium]
MSDFHQNGVISTLHNLRSRDIADLEGELVQFARQRPLSLILPCLYSELEGPALPRIVEVLRQVPYLTQIIIGLDCANANQFAHAQRVFAQLPQPHFVLWNDGPRLRAIQAQLAAEGLAPGEPGKGRNVWYCLGFLLATQQSGAVALHDADILTYDRNLLARLLYPVAHPGFHYQFSKGYYARIAQAKLNGRVSRLLVGPLCRTLRTVFGDHPYLDYMASFRYPLAGEFALRTDAVDTLKIPTDWGLEIGVLSEMYRNYSAHRVCQVEVADHYDHKHQPLSADDAQRGLSKMSVDIIKAFYRKLATTGVVFTSEHFRSIKATYYRAALDYIESYGHDAALNGLRFDHHAEEQAVETFAHNIVRAGQHFLEHPMEQPFVPSWNRVRSALPGVLEELHAAVRADAGLTRPVVTRGAGHAVA